MVSILDSLTPAQREAVTHIDGPLLILAGPGSGKTRVITNRIAYMLQEGVRDWQILALTFTNKAAEEMRNRVSQQAPGHRVWLSTFHRFCAWMLRQHAAAAGLEPNFAIYDSADSRRVVKRVLGGLDRPVASITPESVASAISHAKNSLVPAEEYSPRHGSLLGDVVAEVYPRYQARLLESNAVDFDDLLLHVARLLQENPELRSSLDERYRYVMVDEYQDTNLAQYAIVRALCIDYPNLAVSGDPDQSIYGWRGANIKNILDFEQDYPQVKVVRLEQNYRSSQRILSAADALIRHNKMRKQKGLFTQNAQGEPVRLVQYATESDEAAGIVQRIAADMQSGRRRPSDFAIFFRMNALSRPLEAAMHEAGVPFQIVRGVEFYQRAEVKDLLAYLQLVNNPRDDLAFARIVNVPARGIGATTLQRLQTFAEQQRLPLLAAAQEAARCDALKKAPAGKLQRFAAMMDRLGQSAASPVEELLGLVLSETGYKEMFADSEEDQGRLANVEELLTAARQFDERHPGSGHLEQYLEESSLVNDVDAWSEDVDSVTMMSLHAAKGLEFPVVFVVALEERILPHERALRDNPSALEEERRLLFVGMTRAMEELHLSTALRRSYRGQTLYGAPSSFLMELPRSEMELETPPGRDGYGRRWSSGPGEFDDYGRERRFGQRGSDAGRAAEFDEAADESWDEETWDDGTPDEAEGHAAAGDLAEAHAPSDADDTSFDVAAFEADAIERDAEPSAPRKPATTAPSEKLRLITADQLAAARGESAGESQPAGAAKPPRSPSPPAAAISPELFKHGMRVRHPEYGLGRIVALSGEGGQRRATVSFPGLGEEHTFVLAYSKLQPTGPT